MSAVVQVAATRPAVGRPAVSRPAVSRPARAAAAYSLKSPARLLRGVIILATAIAFALSSISGSFAGSAADVGSEPRQFAYATVAVGESLWQLASVHAPNQDPRDWISEVMVLNQLQTNELFPGQLLALP